MSIEPDNEKKNEENNIISEQSIRAVNKYDKFPSRMLLWHRALS